MAVLTAKKRNTEEAHRTSLASLDILDQVRRIRPSDFYEPHQVVEHPEAAREIGQASGQLQFHESDHIVRVAAPGNGWGGTTAMGCEIDAWCRHTNRWQVTPDRPIVALWCCPQFKQFEIVKNNLIEYCFGTIPTYKESGTKGPRFEWPDGSVCYIISYDRQWQYIQGIELDLCAFDEQPPRSLWGELQQRRRGKKKTRYICKATQTKGWSWMGEQIYKPWLEYHRDLGLTEDEAHDHQLHPEYWVWPSGGIHDNPVADQEDIEWYTSRPWRHARERKVRIWGGFESWIGDPVFDIDALIAVEERMAIFKAQHGPGQNGSFAIPAEMLQ